MARATELAELERILDQMLELSGNREWDALAAQLARYEESSFRISSIPAEKHEIAVLQRLLDKQQAIVAEITPRLEQISPMLHRFNNAGKA